jgi:hypothetical protein
MLLKIQNVLVTYKPYEYYDAQSDRSTEKTA